MKNIFYTLFLLVAMQLQAQQYPVTGITISLPVNPNPKTSTWGVGTSIFSINVSTRPIAGKIDPILEGSRILVQIKKGGAKACGSYTASSAPATNFTSISKMWNGPAATSLLGEECSLTPGDYELCVRIYGGPTNTPMSEEKCKAFSIPSEITSYNKPQNVLPIDNAIFSVSVATQPVNLKWIAVMPKPAGNITYQIKIWKINSGQTAAQAISQNLPVVTKDVLNQTQTTITNLIEPACILSTTGCQYVWQVQALGADNATYGANNGKSDFTVFNVLKPATTVTAACNSISTKTFVTGDEIKLSDDFIMKLTANPTGTNDSLFGVGTVRVKWLGNFNVRFKGIKIDGNNKLCKGAVFTNKEAMAEYPVQFLVNALNVNNYGGEWSINKLREASTFIKANKQVKPLVPGFLSSQVDSSFAIVPINMPVGYFKDGDTANCIGFTEMIFRADYAEFEAIANLNTQKFFKDPANPFNGTESISLRGVGIKFTNEGLKSIVGSIKLVEPVVVTYANNGTEDLKLKFNKEANGHIGNGIVFDGLGTNLWKYNLDVDMTLPKEWLVPTDGSNNNVNLNFQLNTSNWSDYVAEATLPACIIPNAKGLGIQVGVIAYDHSLIANPTNMVFPTGYGGNQNAFFTGFYLKNFKLTLPDELRSYADTSKKIEVIAQNLIIDEFGLSGKIFANNVLSFPLANIGNLGASIDTVSVAFANNALTEAKMLGKIVLPLSESNDVQNAINYKALFSSGNAGFVFTLKPNNDIKSKFLGDGKLQINQTSTLSLTLNKVNNKRAISFNIDINGSLYYPTGKIIDPGSSIPLDLDLSCNFQHLGMTYSTGTTDNFTFNPGQWSFASPQKKFSGFAFTITDVKPKIDTIPIIGNTKQFLFKGGVELVAKINIGSENSNIAISGNTKLILRGAIVSEKYTPPTVPSGINVYNAEYLAGEIINDQASFLAQIKPKYIGVEVKSIAIDVTTAAVKIKGSVAFYKHDVKYGNGFKGELQATFKTAGIALQAGAIFGNTKYIPNNTATPFKYWMVEAQATFPDPGIPFLGGIAFRGFGAGVYSRMNMTPPAVFNPTTANSSTFGGAIFTPDASVKFGFKAKVILATTPKEETFNGSAALGAEFNNQGGLNFIDFAGLFYCGAKIGDETNAFGSGSILARYDFPVKTFTMNVKINIDKDPISTPAPIDIRLYINGKDNKWYFKAGTPTHPMAVKINNTNVEAYLMFGNDLGTDIPNGFMQKTVQGFTDLGYSLPTFSDNATSQNKYQSAKGFAFGIGVHNKKEDDEKLLGVNFKYTINAGGEINASLLQYANCNGFGKGWRATVGIAVYAGALATWNVGKKGGTLADVKGVASCYAEFPNPSYISGKVQGNFDLLGGLYKGSINREFSIGDQCSGTEQATNATTTYTQQNVKDSLSFSLIKEILTPTENNVARNTSLSVLLNYPYNKSFDVDEQQASGEVKTRTFRATYTVSLKQDSTNTTLQANQNLSSLATANNTPLSTNNINTGGSAKANSNTTSTGTKPNLTTPKTSATGVGQNAQMFVNTEVPISSDGVDAMGAQKFKLGIGFISKTVLKPNTSYCFTVVGKLEELVNGNWVAVKKKNTNVSITQTRNLYFKTNSVEVSTQLQNASGSTTKKFVQ